MAEYAQESYDALVKALEDARAKHAEAQLQIGVVTEGDANAWHDNFAFEEANRQELLLRGRVARLAAQVAKAVVVEKKGVHSVIQVGSRVVVKIDDDEETFVIAGEHNELRRSSEGYLMLSQITPLGSALMGKTPGGQPVRYTLPNGTTQEATIIKVW